MKQKLFSLMLLVFALSMQTEIYAQNNRKANVDGKTKVRMTSEQFMARQTRYVASQLALDDAKTASFTKLYKQYLTEVKECQNQWRSQYRDKDRKEHKELTDAEITKRIEGRFAHSHKILDIREKYYNEFKKILNPRQIQKMYKAEKDIQKKVRKEMGRRINNKRNK